MDPEWQFICGTGLGLKKRPPYRRLGPIKVETTYLHTSFETGLADLDRMAAAFKSLSQGHGIWKVEEMPQWMSDAA